MLTPWVGSQQIPCHNRAVEETHVVTCFLLRAGPHGRDELLILRRSGRVRTYRGRWAGVSGYLESARTGAGLGEPPEPGARPPSPEDQARREVQEETGLSPADASWCGPANPSPSKTLSWTHAGQCTPSSSAYDRERLSPSTGSTPNRGGCGRALWAATAPSPA